MKALIPTLGILASPAFGADEHSSHARWYFAYAEQRMVDYARSMGYDPSAEIGREIPSNVPILVPHAGMENPVFEVSVGFQIFQLVANSPARHLYIGASFNVAFDRAFTTASPMDNPPDQFSFQKLAWGTEDVRQAFSYFTYPAFDRFGNIMDLNDDGVQDRSSLFTQTSAENFGVYRRGVEDPNSLNIASLRSIGFACDSGVADIAGYPGVIQPYHEVAFMEKRNLMTIKIRSQMEAGEVFGDTEEETGMRVSVDNILRGSAGTWLSFVNSTATGTRGFSQKYQVRAVPEPATLLALGAGMLALRRRRK